MATQEREIVDLLWDNDRADALDKIKDMLQVKAAAAVCLLYTSDAADE